MGVDLVIVGDEDVEAVFFGHARRPSTATAPLAEPARGVADPPEQRSDRFFVGSHGVPPSSPRTDVCPACLPVIRQQRVGARVEAKSQLDGPAGPSTRRTTREFRRSVRRKSSARRCPWCSLELRPHGR